MPKKVLLLNGDIELLKQEINDLKREINDLRDAFSTIQKDIKKEDNQSIMDEWLGGKDNG